MNNEKEINESKLKPCPFCGSAVKIDNIQEVDGSDYYMMPAKMKDAVHPLASETLAKQRMVQLRSGTDGLVHP